MSEILNILLIEDRQSDEQLILHTLRENGYDPVCTRVQTENDFIQSLKDQPDIIISDYSLPQFNGMRALQILKEMNIEIPFILVSGVIGEEMAVALMKAGANDYIMKDNLSKLPAAVKRELHESNIKHQLKETEKRYQNLVELSPDAIFITLDNKFIFANSACCKLFGAQSSEQLLNQNIFNFIHPLYHNLVKERIQYITEQRKSVPMVEEKFIRLNKEIIDVEVVAAPFELEDELAFQVFARDITQRKKAESKIIKHNKLLKKHIIKNKQLQYADLMKSEFLATMSHELRTPMSSILGFSEILKDELIGPLTNKQKEYATNIYKSGQHLLSLLNDILDLSKIEAGKMHLDPEPVNLRELLQESITIIEEKSAHRSIQVNLILDEKIKTAHFDPRKVKQIIYNLLSNALKFTPNNGKITLEAQITQDSFVEIIVSDTGAGIAPENIEKLFQPFLQVGKASDPHEKGTGLGLMVVKRLVELHSGNIKVNSKPNEGTQFTVQLPYSQGYKNEEKIQQKNKQPLFEVKRNNIATVLVVEDDPKSAELIGLQLSELGFNMVWKPTAEEALAIGDKQKFDLIILDIVLPGMSGLDMISEIKNHKHLANVPFIVVSIVANEQKGHIFGEIDVLQKPIGRTDLINTILKYVQSDTIVENYNVLVVDDDPSAIELLKMYLDDLQCNPICVNDGEQALEYLKNELPNLIILDLLMPKLDGFELLNSLKNDERTSDIPIIILSSKILTKNEQQTLRKNAVKILKKQGFSINQLREEIHRYIMN